MVPPLGGQTFRAEQQFCAGKIEGVFLKGGGEKIFCKNKAMLHLIS